MKCVLKVHTKDKMKVLDIALCSIEQKVKGDYTYLWYETLGLADDDQRSLDENGIGSELIKGWEVDGFITIK